MHDAVDDRVEALSLVRGDEGGAATRPDLAHQMRDQLAGRRVEPGMGLVEEQQQGLGEQRPNPGADDVRAAEQDALGPFRPPDQDGPMENPYTVHTDLQQVMNDLVGIIRREGEIIEALEQLGLLRERARRAGVEGHRQFNPGWHLALDLRNMLDVCECVARAALERQESRGGHTREDHPVMDPAWRGVNLVCAQDVPGGPVTLRHQPVPAIRPDLLALFDRAELGKYLTPQELA